MKFKLVDIKNIRLDIANPRIADWLTKMSGYVEEMYADHKVKKAEKILIKQLKESWNL